jgi:glutamine amidotransferase
MPQQVAVIDYGSGNLHSVAKAIEHNNAVKVVVTGDPEQIRQADRVVLPGVGAMGDCLEGLRARGLDQLIDELIGQIPLMGVCVGMQILAESGEESDGVEALGVFPGQVTRFSSQAVDADGLQLKVPHMGWNQVMQRAHPMWTSIPDATRFYFVHSYRYAQTLSEQVVGVCDYGDSFAAALACEGVFAVQFHPEKSHDMGLRLYRNFLTWDGTC